MSNAPTTEGGVEWELTQAENAIIAAGADPVALAQAQRRHADAVRNMMQGVLVPSFVQLVERVLGEKIDPVGVKVDGLRADVQQLAVETATRLGKLEKGLQALNKRHGAQIQGIAQRMDTSELDRGAIHTEIAAFRDEFQQYIAGSKRSEFAQKIDDLEQHIRALEARGDGA